MNVLEVTLSEIENAAAKIATQNEAFRDAAAALKSATGTLSDSWTGVAHDDFVSVMEERLAWYEQMATIVDDYVAMLKEAAAKYEETDGRATAAIRKR